MTASISGQPPRDEWSRPEMAPYTLRFACGHSAVVEPMNPATDIQVEIWMAEALSLFCSIRCSTPSKPTQSQVLIRPAEHKTKSSCIVCGGAATMSASMGPTCPDHYDDASS